jgi:hypothetical protein
VVEKLPTTYYKIKLPLVDKWPDVDQGKGFVTQVPPHGSLIEHQDKIDASTVHDLKTELEDILTFSHGEYTSKSAQDSIRIQNTVVGTSKTWQAGAKV